MEHPTILLEKKGTEISVALPPWKKKGRKIREVRGVQKRAGLIQKHYPRGKDGLDPKGFLRKNSMGCEEANQRAHRSKQGHDTIGDGTIPTGRNSEGKSHYRPPPKEKRAVTS